jgi:hypothetical protein
MIPEKPQLKKELKLGHLVFLASLNMAANNLHALQVVLLLAHECLSEVRCSEISCTTTPALLGGILRPVSSLFTLGLLTNSENVV